LAGSSLGRFEFAGLFALQRGEGLPKLVVELFTGVPHHREVLGVVVLLPPFDQHVVSGLVGAELQQAGGISSSISRWALLMITSYAGLDRCSWALWAHRRHRRSSSSFGGSTSRANRVELPGRRVLTNSRWAMWFA
jgi:hypothetical protein